MDFTLLQSLWTIVVMVTFLGIVWWAWNAKSQRDFDAAARLPFDEDEPQPPSE